VTLNAAGGGDLTARVEQLEDQWHQLNSLPTNSEMFRRLHQFRQIETGREDDAAAAETAPPPAAAETAPPPPPAATKGNAAADSSSAAPLCRPRQPMLELWHAMQLLNQVENNTAGITRVRRNSRA